MKLKERVAIGVAAGLTLFTLLLVVDLQMGLSGKHSALLYSHGKVRFNDPVQEPLAFKSRFLQRSANVSKEQASAAASDAQGGTSNGTGGSGPHRSASPDSNELKKTPPDNFHDLVEYALLVGQRDAGSGHRNDRGPSLGQIAHVKMRLAFVFLSFKIWRNT